MATAMGMFGPGFVWLIHNPHAKTDPNDPPLTILCTYIAGSPLPGAHPRAQTVDMTTMNALTGQRGVGNIGPHSLSRESQIPPGRMTTAEICLGVCTWEHVWVRIFAHSAFGNLMLFLLTPKRTMIMESQRRLKNNI